ncbi:xanthine dehydrogenase family protein molybdopterin-binding subunit [Streptomyces sp. NBC_01716]|uniref:xanthine dehydrogenase family protein molybdopterin-binding subunit n=1 Tax=Streptomyces sp. NBC_01716 TaxID=2975917 RepID=UPI002E3407E7|nr:xanthine dehydrogenase family protein molybdopterin-binding subunit [Streptomyces sp. NBC_01716]
MTTSRERALGSAAVRIEGLAKVGGTARYSAEHTPPGCLYAWVVPAAVAKGRITSIDTAAALAEPGAVAVLTHENAQHVSAPDDATLGMLRDDRVPHRGWIIAVAVGETLEAARATADAVRVSYAAEEHDVVLTADHPGLYAPEVANGGYPGTRERGDFDTVYAAAPVTVDVTYSMDPTHNHPMEPHASVAQWHDGRLTVYDSSQGSSVVRETLASLFSLDPAQVTVISDHVGGGFGSKGTPRPQPVLAALAARHVGRPVKLALHRSQLAAVVGHRPPTIQRVRFGADQDGVISALAHEMVSYTSTVKEFVEQAATSARTMYTSPHSRTVHRVTALDVPTPSWMRAPGEAPGMYALESAMDELALAVGVDPVELRVRNDPSHEPDSGRPYSSRHLVECLREGARRFGWGDRDPRAGLRREGRFLVGSGVASASYPVFILPSTAEARADANGGFLVRVNATDIGTGARTVLAQIAADALHAPFERVRIVIGDSDLPTAPLAGGSAGTGSWGWSVDKACRALRARIDEVGGTVPSEGLSASADTTEDVAAGTEFARHAYGAHFAEVQVDTDTAEIRVRRMLGVYAAGRILNPRTARSQFIGGMTMGLGMALMEGATIDPVAGDFVERDLASYHVPAHADVRSLEAYWIEEDDRHLNPMGSKGIGEIGIVGTAAAIGNAVRHATGVRLRELPMLPDRLLPHLG